jgi:hypothetical protein
LTILKKSESSSEIKKSEIDKELVLNALKYFVALRNETIPPETLLAWISEFENLGLTTNEVLTKIKETGLKKIYGKTTFDCFLNDEETHIDYDLVNIKANEKCWYVMNQIGITNDNFNEFQRNKFKTQYLENKETLLLAQETEYTQKIKDMNKTIKQAQLELLYELSKEIPSQDYTALKVIKRKMENL